MGGGVMLTTVAGGGGPSDPLTIPRATTTNLHSHQPSSSSSHLNFPVSADSTAPFRSACAKSSCLGETCKGLESFVGGREDKRASGSFYDSVFGPVPSRNEVEKAMSSLQRFILGFPTPEFDWLQRMLQLYNPRMLLSVGYGRVADAVRLLQREPLLQRMIISISCDKAVWDAILNNKEVQNLRESLCTAKEESPRSSSEESDLAALIVKWVLDITKAMVLELIERFSSLVNKIFQPREKKKVSAEISDQLDAELRSSLLLSIVILLIVVVTRAHGA